MQLAELMKQLQAEFPSSHEDFSYSDEYVAIETEQQKRFSLYNEKPDYALIIQNALTLLKQGSGQIFIITSLAHAVLQQYHWHGLLNGLNFLYVQLQRPSAERLKTRVQGLNWLLERYEEYLKTHALTGFSSDFLKQVRVVLMALDSLCRKQFKDQVNVQGLIRPFAEQEKRLKFVAQAEEERKALALQNLQQTLIQNTQETESIIDQQLEFLKQTPFEFSLYKYSRAEMWWRYPLSSQELLVLIDEQGLDWDAYAAALKLKTAQKYQEALLAFEALSHTCPYFLDLQLHICECLQALGAEGALVTMLKNECQQLLARYPELETAKIQGEYPVWSQQVKAYLEFC